MKEIIIVLALVLSVIGASHEYHSGSYELALLNAFCSGWLSYMMASALFGD